MKKNPRICIVTPVFPQISETFLVNKLLGLLKNGWDAYVFCTKSDPSKFTYFPELLQNVEHRRRVYTAWPHEPKWLGIILLPFALFECLLSNPVGTLRYIGRGWKETKIQVLRYLYLDAKLLIIGPDLIHYEFGSTARGKSYLKDWLGAKVVVSFRGFDLNYIGLNDVSFYDDIWKNADSIHLLGKDLWIRAQKRGCPAKKSHSLIPPSIDINYFHPGDKHHQDHLGKANRALRILSVGRLVWKKGYEYSLQAVEYLEGRGIHCEYRIIGEGNYIDHLAFLRYLFGLEDVVDFMGRQPQTTVKSQMQWADVFLHSAVSEGFSNSVMEAQAMKLPVVCSDADGLSENVLNGVTGFVVPRRNYLELAQKLEVLINPEIRQKMGEEGRKRVTELFRIEDQIKSFENFYSRVLTSH
jgi:colanic acid/amylovoran biosynthesis glycosyltransferase